MVDSPWVVRQNREDLLKHTLTNNVVIGCYGSVELLSCSLANLLMTCVCVCERERERERGRQTDLGIGVA